MYPTLERLLQHGFGHITHDNYTTLCPGVQLNLRPIQKTLLFLWLPHPKDMGDLEGYQSPNPLCIFLLGLQANRQGRTIHPTSNLLYGSPFSFSVFTGFPLISSQLFQ